MTGKDNDELLRQAVNLGSMVCIASRAGVEMWSDKYAIEPEKVEFKFNTPTSFTMKTAHGTVLEVSVNVVDVGWE